MRRSRFLLSLAVLTLSLAACAVPVRTEYVHRVDYTRFHSFAWLPPPPSALRNPLLQSGIIEERIKNDIFSILRARGYRPIKDRARASFLVTLHLVPYRKIVSRPSFGYGFFFGYDDFFGPGNVVLVNNNSVSAHRRGYIVVDVIDGRTHKLIWRGWLSRGLHRWNFTRRALYRSLVRILRHFPPPASG
jgi:hypothetical protein